MPPWERYQQQIQPAPASGPWQRYARPSEDPEGRVRPGQPRGGADLAMPGTELNLDDGPNRNEAGYWLNEAGNQATAFQEGMTESIPVLGPAMTNAANATGSQLASMITGRPADELRQEGEAAREADLAPYGGARTVGAVAGTVGPLAAAGATTAGARMLGLQGTLPQRVGAGMVSGGTLAGADSMARTGDLEEAGRSAAFGAGLGGVAPLAEKALSPLARMITGQPRPSADINAFSRALQRDRIAPESLRQRLDAWGDLAMPADLGRNMGREAGAIASLPGEGQTILDDALTARQAGTNARIQGDVDAALGPSVGPRAFSQGVRDQQKQLSPLYEQAFANARAVDTSPIALDLESLAVNARGEAQTVARQLRGMLNVTGEDALDPNPRTLFEVRKAIDGMMDGVQDGNARRVLTDTRQQVDNMLADAVPGIKDVDRQFSELARQREAYETGQSALDSARTSMTPGDLDAYVASNADAVIDALSAGARADIDRIIGTTANDITALKRTLKGDGSWNRQRLATLFGQDKADQLLNVLEREAAFNATYSQVLQNSETAGRGAAMAERSPRQFGDTSTSLIDLFMKVPQAAANAGARGRSEAVNRRLADLLTNRPTPETVDRLIAANRMRRGLMPPASVPLLTDGQ